MENNGNGTSAEQSTVNIVQSNTEPQAEVFNNDDVINRESPKDNEAIKPESLSNNHSIEHEQPNKNEVIKHENPDKNDVIKNENPNGNAVITNENPNENDVIKEENPDGNDDIMKQENVEDNRKNSMEKTDVINRSSPDKNGVNESESPHKHEVTSNEMVNPSQVPEDKKQSDAVASFPSKTSKTQSEDPPTIIVPVDSPDASQQINTQEGRPTEKTLWTIHVCGCCSGHLCCSSLCWVTCCLPCVTSFGVANEIGAKACGVLSVVIGFLGLAVLISSFILLVTQPFGKTHQKVRDDNDKLTGLTWQYEIQVEVIIFCGLVILSFIVFTIIVCVIRRSMRRRFNIKGEACNDCCCSFFCCECVLCQMKTHLEDVRVALRPKLNECDNDAKGNPGSCQG